MKYLVLDTETTGIKPGNICQLAYVMTDGEGNLQGKNFFFPVSYMPKEALRIHGFGVEKLKILSEGIEFSERAHLILEDIKQTDLIVGHNISFDLRFLKTELKRAGYAFPSLSSFCTMQHFTPICRLSGKNGSWRYPRLEELATCLEIKNRDIQLVLEEAFCTSEMIHYHDARYDVAIVVLALQAGLSRGLISSF